MATGRGVAMSGEPAGFDGMVEGPSGRLIVLAD
jgi:hypothetical protein